MSSLLDRAMATKPKEDTAAANANDNGGAGAGDNNAGGTGGGTEGNDNGGASSTTTNSTSNTPAGADSGGSDAATAVLTDEQILAKVREYRPDIKSLDDLKKPEPQLTPEQREKKKRDRMFAWGIKTEKIDSEKLEKYHRDSAKPSRQLVYEAFSKEQKAKGKDPEQIDRAFKKLYHEEIVDENDPDELEVSQLAQEKLNTEAKRLLRKSYPEFYNLEKEYDKAVSEHESNVARNQTLQQNTVAYNDTVESFIADAKKISYKIGDENDPEEIDFEFKPEVLEALRKEFLGDLRGGFIENFSQTALQGAMKLRLLEMTDEQRIEAACKRYYSQRRAKEKIGRNNLTPDDPGSSVSAPEVDLDARRRVQGYIPTA